jgi:hypothetical protein
MLATALGHKAVEHGYRVYYTTPPTSSRAPRAALEGRWATTMRFWNGPPAAADRRREVGRHQLAQWSPRSRARERETGSW